MGQRMKRDWLDDKDVIQMLRAEVERAGSQRAFAIKVGLNRNNVNRMLNGKMPLTKSVIRTLKLRTVFIPSPDDR
jgi:plasmid maintenance system antidote protein VapI